MTGCKAKVFFFNRLTAEPYWRQSPKSQGGLTEDNEEKLLSTRDLQSFSFRSMGVILTFSP